MAAKKALKFIAVVEENQMDNINNIVDEIKANGGKVNQVLSLSGIISGEAKDLEKINCLSGIKSVEIDKKKKGFR